MPATTDEISGGDCACESEMMAALTDASLELLETTRGDAHPNCVVCGRCGGAGLGLEFEVRPDGAVSAEFNCLEGYCGYCGMLHGGVISAIADGAMTNCLFAHGIAAVTAELNVRFRHPIELGKTLRAMARITRRSSPIFVVEAELVQAGQLKAKATGKFMETPVGPRT